MTVSFITDGPDKLARARKAELRKSITKKIRHEQPL
jgi:hypothetical protein